MNFGIKNTVPPSIISDERRDWCEEAIRTIADVLCDLCIAARCPSTDAKQGLILLLKQGIDRINERMPESETLN